MFYTYILKGKNEKYYVGYTGDIDRRIMEHKKHGNKKYTGKMGGEVELLGYFEYIIKKDAIVLEKKIKRSGHISRYIIHENFIKNIDI